MLRQPRSLRRLRAGSPPPMSDLTPNLAADVVAACSAGGAEAADALGRALDGAFALGAAGSPTTYSAATPPVGFDGSGLLIVLTIGGAGFALAIPESSGLLPAWYAAPDATGESKLSTLAQELSMLLVPETLAADKFEARRVPSLQAALDAASVAADAALVVMPLTSGPKEGVLSLVWPLAAPAKAFAAEAASQPADAASSASQPAATANPAPQTPPPHAASHRPRSPVQSCSELPHYSRSLLRIAIPVSVHLATKKETVQEVVEIVPGAIIKFDKGCDELLQMVIGGQPVAEGEAVKVGDKFGFRVSKMLLPREHFIPVRRPRAG
jgi:flagellar motor switch protein FliN/FliY